MLSFMNTRSLWLVGALAALALSAPSCSCKGGNDDDDDDDDTVPTANDDDDSTPTDDDDTTDDDDSGCELTCDDGELVRPDSEDCECIPHVRPLMQMGGDAEFFDSPWPGDWRRLPDGRLDLERFPTNNNDYLTKHLPAIKANVYGFGTNSALYVRFNGAIDPATLPADAAGSLSGAASVFLVCIDPESADYGLRTPLEFQFEDAPRIYTPDNLLAMLPLGGFTLRPLTQYGLLVTNRLKDARGRPVRTAEEWSAILDGSAPAGTLSQFAPLLEFMDDLNIDPSTIVAGSVFTTQDPATGMRAMADYVNNLPDHYPSLQTLDTLATHPDDPRDDHLHLIGGYYESPIFQDGDPIYASEGGEIHFDEDGAPIVQYFDALAAVITIPADFEMPEDGWPVMLYHHGTGGSAFSFYNDGTANNAALEGVAMIGIDQPLHGERDPTSNNAGPNLFYNFNNPVAGLDNTRQAAADLLVLQRLALHTNLPSGTMGYPIRFDPSRVMVMGHSQGGGTAPIMMGVASGIRSAMFSGAGASLTPTMLYKEEPFPVRPLVEGILGLDGNETLDAFHPAIMIAQTFWEPADPLNYAPYYFRWEGGQPFDVWVTHGLLDLYVPTPVTTALAVAIGMHPVSPVFRPSEGLAIMGFDTLTAPVSANLTGMNGLQYTGVYAQYEEGDHFLVRKLPGAVDQLRRWFRSSGYESEAQLIPYQE